MNPIQMRGSGGVKTQFGPNSAQNEPIRDLDDLKCVKISFFFVKCILREQLFLRGTLTETPPLLG